jgi:hypothetical protein
MLVHVLHQPHALKELCQKINSRKRHLIEDNTTILGELVSDVLTFGRVPETGLKRTTEAEDAVDGPT